MANEQRSLERALDVVRDILRDTGYTYAEHLCQWIVIDPVAQDSELMRLCAYIAAELNADQWQNERIAQLALQLLDECGYRWDASTQRWQRDA